MSGPNGEFGPLFSMERIWKKSPIKVGCHIFDGTLEIMIDLKETP